jgi:hypothetical protein
VTTIHPSIDAALGMDIQNGDDRKCDGDAGVAISRMHATFLFEALILIQWESAMMLRALLAASMRFGAPMVKVMVVALCDTEEGLTSIPALSFHLCCRLHTCAPAHLRTCAASAAMASDANTNAVIVAVDGQDRAMLGHANESSNTSVHRAQDAGCRLQGAAKRTGDLNAVGEYRMQADDRSMLISFVYAEIERCKEADVQRLANCGRMDCHERKSSSRFLNAPMSSLVDIEMLARRCSLMLCG